METTYLYETSGPRSQPHGMAGSSASRVRLRRVHRLLSDSGPPSSHRHAKFSDNIGCVGFSMPNALRSNTPEGELKRKVDTDLQNRDLPLGGSCPLATSALPHTRLFCSDHDVLALQARRYLQPASRTASSPCRTHAAQLWDAHLRLPHSTLTASAVHGYPSAPQRPSQRSHSDRYPQTLCQYRKHYPA